MLETRQLRAQVAISGRHLDTPFRSQTIDNAHVECSGPCPGGGHFFHRDTDGRKKWPCKRLCGRCPRFSVPRWRFWVYTWKHCYGANRLTVRTLSARGRVQVGGISSTWTSISVISSYHLREPGRLSAAVGTSEPSHRARQSPDSDATDTGTFGGSGDTPLTHPLPNEDGHSTELPRTLMGDARVSHQRGVEQV